MRKYIREQRVDAVRRGSKLILIPEDQLARLYQPLVESTKTEA